VPRIWSFCKPIKYENMFRVISAEELAAVMISLGNPRTKEEIEVSLILET